MDGYLESDQSAREESQPRRHQQTSLEHSSMKAVLPVSIVIGGIVVSPQKISG